MQDALQDLISDLSGGVSFSRASAMLVTRVTNILNCDVCSLFVLDSKTQNLQLLANEGYRDIEPNRIVVPPQTGVIGLVVTRKEPLNLTNVNEHPDVYFVEEYEENGRSGPIPKVVARSIRSRTSPVLCRERASKLPALSTQR